MEQTSTSKRFLTWGIFTVIIGLIIWGLVAAQQKASRESANIVLPDQIVASDHAMGSTVAPVTLVEYGDFQCPACAAYYPLVKQVLAELGPDKVRFVARHYPLPQHGNAMAASQASEAAGVQGKFWEMYNLLYERQKSWESASDPKVIFLGYAKEMGLDEEKFLEDFDRQDLKDKILNDYKGGSAAGINSTPSFFVNGKKITNPISLDEFKKILNDAATTTAL